MSDRLRELAEGVIKAWNEALTVQEFNDALGALEKFLAESPKDLSTLVAEKIRSEHKIKFIQKPRSEYQFECSCGAKWTTIDSWDKAEESMRSHHISVGLKPSEVL
jgi:hypothetical protein